MGNVDHLIQKLNAKIPCKDMNSRPSGAINDEEQTRRVSFNKGVRLAFDLGEPSKKLASHETEVQKPINAKEVKDDEIASLDVIKKSLSEVQLFTRQLSLKREESVRSIASTGECAVISWCRSSRPVVQGRIMKRSMSVGCVIRKPEAFSTKEVGPLPTTTKASTPVPPKVNDESPKGRRSSGSKARQSKRQLMRCLSTPVINSSPRPSKKKSPPKKKITRCRTAPQQGDQTTEKKQSGSCFNWEDWANKKRTSNKASSPPTRTRSRPFLPGQVSMSCLIPTPEGSTLDDELDCYFDATEYSFPMDGDNLDVFDWKEWAKNQSRRGRDSRRHKTKRAASERTLQSCSGSLRIQRQASCRSSGHRHSVAGMS